MSNKYKNDALGTRMKQSYENRARRFFPRRTYTLLRIDGRAFHSWTRGLTKPYDVEMMECMDAAALYIVKEAAGALFAYVQSDEISIVLTDFSDVDTQPWFDGNQSKLESITASLATVGFNLKVQEFKNLDQLKVIDWLALKNLPHPTQNKISTKIPNAVFDSRAWTIPDPIEVENYFIWRQQDAERNSVTLLASAYATHKELRGKKTADRHDIIYRAGDNWNNHPASFKRGRVIRKVVNAPSDVHTGHCDQGPYLRSCKYGENESCTALVGPKKWAVDKETPIFTANRWYLQEMIPDMPQFNRNYW